MQRPRGFTLIELIIVGVLLGLLALVASTRVQDTSLNVRISAAINQITSDLEQVKTLALAHHKNMSLTFNVSTEAYSIHKNGTLMTDYPGSNSGTIDLSQGTFTGVNITSTNINGSNVINIDKWGNVLNNGTITLNDAHTITFKKLTGHWEVSPP